MWAAWVAGGVTGGVTGGAFGVQEWLGVIGGAGFVSPSPGEIVPHEQHPVTHHPATTTSMLGVEGLGMLMQLPPTNLLSSISLLPTR